MVAHICSIDALCSWEGKNLAQTWRWLAVKQGFPKEFFAWETALEPFMLYTARLRKY